jgi:hypothetical protein
VVLEVDKACVLEALEDSFGSRLLRRAIVGEELRKVDELFMSGQNRVKCGKIGRVRE